MLQSFFALNEHFRSLSLTYICFKVARLGVVSWLVLLINLKREMDNLCKVVWCCVS